MKLENDLQVIESEEMKRLQIELLSEVHNACNKLGIKYTLHSGTALGAVRHRGFIPWDDDIDVAMLREDYEVFAREFPNMISCDYMKLLDGRKDRGVRCSFLKLIDNRTLMRTSAAEDRISIDDAVFIDIFPLDGMPKIAFFADIHLRFLYFIRLCSLMASRSLYSRRRSFLKNVTIIVFNVFTLGTSYSWWNRIINYFATRFPAKNSRWIGCTMAGYSIREKIPAQCYHDIQLMPFENRNFYVMKGVEEYLSLVYGNYMTPPPENLRRPGHHIAAYWRKGYGSVE